MDELAATSPIARPEDVESLARELGRAYLRMITFHRDRLGLSAAEADQRARDPGSAEYRAGIIESPPDQASWFALSTLAEHDPEATWRLWERIQAEARAELASGHRAATTFEWDDSPWDRARFLAIRQAFIEQWQPRGGVEQILIDQMAQAHTAYLFWMTRVHVLSVTEGKQEDDKLKGAGYWQPPRLDTAAAIDQSAAMADRFHRMFLRALRALQDLRRYAPAVVVQSVGQLNLGGAQVNVSHGGSES